MKPPVSLDHSVMHVSDWEVCNAFWNGSGPVDFQGKHYQLEGGRLHTPFLAPNRDAPEIYVSGHSAPAFDLSLAQGSCWVRIWLVRR